MDISNLELAPEVEQFLLAQKDFIIDRISKEGGNCDIFFGQHNIFQRRIALKVYEAPDKGSAHNEPKVLSTLDHENILRVRDARQISPYHSYFMTDEIDGGDLEKFYKAGKLDLQKALAIIHGILCGLSELHRDGVRIVHRDIKPKNILIKEDNCQPLIADFGSIKHFSKSLSIGGSRTTTLYKPKEVIETNTYTIQSDLYQVGVTMFQILGGHFPDTYDRWLSDKERRKFDEIPGWYDKTVFVDQCIYKRISKGELLDLDTLPPYINPKIKKIIKKAIHVNLNIRYPNAASFMSDLMKAQRGLINWWKSGDVFNAITQSGKEYRIIFSPKGYYTERKGTSGWRRVGGWSEGIHPQIEKCV